MRPAVPGRRGDASAPARDDVGARGVASSRSQTPRRQRPPPRARARLWASALGATVPGLHVAVPEAVRRGPRGAWPRLRSQEVAGALRCARREGGGVQGCRRRRPPPGRCVRSERRPGGWRTRARAPEGPGGLAFLGFCEAQRDVPEGRGRPVPRGPLASPRDTFSFPVPSAVSPEQRPRGPARMLGVGRRPERPAWAGTGAQCLSPLPPRGPGPARPPCRSLS